MSGEMFIAKLVESVKEIPASVNILATRQYTTADLQNRAKTFLEVVGKVFGLPFERGDWVDKEDRVLIHLPVGCLGILYKASGSMNLAAGLNPMEGLFDQIVQKAELEKLVADAANRLNIAQWAGKNGAFRFERLWQIKAAAANKEGKVTEPKLCRVVGAYRHFVDNLPVWGPASIALKLAGGGKLDSLAVEVRETTGEVFDKVPILPPEKAAQQIYLQVSNRLSQSKTPVDEIAAPQWMSFGYLNLNKRKPQRLLVPVYVAAVEIRGKDTVEAHLLVASATEKPYLDSLNMAAQAGPVKSERTV